MALLSGFRSDQLIRQLVSESDANSTAAQKVIERLKKIGPKVIPKIIDALAMSDKSHMMVFVDILASHVNNKTLKYFREGLGDGGERVVKGTAWALSSSNNYDANSLLEFFDDPEVSKPALIEILKVHKMNLSVHDLLRRAYALDAKEKAALFAIIEDVMSIDMVPDLIARMGGKDPAIKIHLIRLLKRFNKDEITRAFEMQLGDTNKLVRSAALAALTDREGHVNIDKVARLLQDPDLDVQSKAIDVLVKINHPETIKFLVPALKDESEYTRRAAVEVLNEVCNPNSVKDLLDAIKDDDWWVRERAVDALAQIGSKKALPKLLDMLGNNAKTDTVVVRALGKLGDADIISRILPMLQRPELIFRSRPSRRSRILPMKNTPNPYATCCRKLNNRKTKRSSIAPTRQSRKSTPDFPSLFLPKTSGQRKYRSTPVPCCSTTRNSRSSSVPRRQRPQNTSRRRRRQFSTFLTWSQEMSLTAATNISRKSAKARLVPCS